MSEDSKTGRADPVPLTMEAKRVLRAQPRQFRCSYVFTDSGGQPYVTEHARNRISKATKAAMKVAGIDDATFHTLRHTAASWMVQGGVPIANVQKFMRHRNVQTTLRYAHLKPEHLGDTVAALDAVLSSGPNSAPTHDGRIEVSKASAATTSKQSKLHVRACSSAG